MVNCMREYEYIFSIAMHDKLRSQVKGGIYVDVRNNNLWVKITHQCGITYESCIVADFSKAVCNGYNAEYAAHDALKSYRRFITNMFFD